MAVDAAARAAVIEGVLKELDEFYIFPAVAAKMAEGIRERWRRNEYDSITSARQFAEELKTDL
jgi:hypothetical protein